MTTPTPQPVPVGDVLTAHQDTLEDLTDTIATLQNRVGALEAVLRRVADHLGLERGELDAEA